jgi:hypothetical protein
MADGNAPPSLEARINETWQRLYLALLEKTTAAIEQTEPADLSAAMVAAARGLLDSNGITKDHVERQLATQRKLSVDTASLPFGVTEGDEGGSGTDRELSELPFR